MKTFSQFIIESPPPEDWDLKVFTKSFDKQIAYAMKRANEINSGSSRVVFEIEFEGRKTALKIAKNKKGLAQNEKEANYRIYQSYPNITIPLIDFDENNSPPRWVHFEKAEPINYTSFKNLAGFSFDYFGDMLMHYVETKNGKAHNDWLDDVPIQLQKEIGNSVMFKEVIQLIDKYDIQVGDLRSIGNWGIYDKRPVIIDLGMDSKVHQKHYSLSFLRNQFSF